MNFNRVIVIDSTNIQFKAIYAYRNGYNRELEKITKEGIDKDDAMEFLNDAISRRSVFLMPPTYTYLQMITGYLNILKFNPETDVVILAMDYGSWRKKISPVYKSQRKGNREEQETKDWWNSRYKEFNELFTKLEVALPFYLLKFWEVEADDIMAVASRVYSDKAVLGISSDQDWEMLAFHKNTSIFSPITKKMKVINNPMKILLDKIQKGDVSDNLLEKPTNELEFEIRKTLVDLINPLPDHIEIPIKEKLINLPMKNLFIEKIPYNSIRLKFKKLFNI
jgi:5'-3' exonuclease